MTQKPVRSLDGIQCFSSEMFGWGDELIGVPMVRCIKFCVNTTNSICAFLDNANIVYMDMPLKLVKRE